jgi:hypothetical protein
MAGGKDDFWSYWISSPTADSSYASPDKFTDVHFDHVLQDYRIIFTVYRSDAVCTSRRSDGEYPFSDRMECGSRRGRWGICLDIGYRCRFGRDVAMG